jgi:hypothetical protein
MRSEVTSDPPAMTHAGMRVALDHAGKWLLNLSHFRTALGADRSQPYGLIAYGCTEGHDEHYEPERPC